MRNAPNHWRLSRTSVTLRAALIGMALSTASMLTACVSSPRISKHALNETGAPTLAPDPAPLLDLHHLFNNPVGPRGLEPTPTLQSLAGQRVRVEGYVVQEESPVPGQFKLAVLPVALAEREDGPADDLPASTVFVHLAPAETLRVLHIDARNTNRLLSVTGTLAVGNLEEPDGRVSYLRLLLDSSAKEI